jgi:hypothetical protein
MSNVAGGGPAPRPPFLGRQMVPYVIWTPQLFLAPISFSDHAVDVRAGQALRPQGSPRIQTLLRA